MEKILITGALGTLGSNLIVKLLENYSKLKIIAVDLIEGLTSPLKQEIGKFEKSSFRYFRLDIKNSYKFTNLLEEHRPDVIIHLASLVNVSKDFELLKNSLDVNFNTLFPIIDYSYKYKIQKLILTGSSDEYGDNISPFNENINVKPISPYSYTKSLGALTAQFVHRVYEIPVVFLRPFAFFGPYQRNNMFIPSLFKAIINGDAEFKMSSGKQIRDINYVLDIAEGFIKAVFTNKIEGKIFNLGSGQSLELKFIANLIKKVTKSDVKLLYGALPYRKSEIMNMVADTNLSSKYLNWKSETPLERAFLETFQWYQANKDFLLN
ncbi:MAG: NAD-dependent epimerase/dehydratase family protein [Candidatus Hodarchaeales archaeon]|jgi:nucleoside-diphosphate-sugar epimerase